MGCGEETEVVQTGDAVAALVYSDYQIVEGDGWEEAEDCVHGVLGGVWNREIRNRVSAYAEGSLRRYSISRPVFPELRIPFRMQDSENDHSLFVVQEEHLVGKAPGKPATDAAVDNRELQRIASSSPHDSLD
jgi:hypothetical protein